MQREAIRNRHVAREWKDVKARGKVQREKQGPEGRNSERTEKGRYSRQKVERHKFQKRGQGGRARPAEKSDDQEERHAERNRTDPGGLASCSVGGGDRQVTAARWERAMWDFR